MDRLAAFLIVKIFPRLYHDYAERYQINHDVYAIPRIDKTPEEYEIQYHGLDRDPLSALRPHIERNLIKDSETYSLAEVRMAEFEAVERADRLFLNEYEDAMDVWNWIDVQADYEVIWARVAGSAWRVPSGFHSVGYEASYFPGGHFSASCDCMLIPRWHGTDESGQLFLSYFRQLNRHGLFQAKSDAEEFLRYYLSFDWTERGDFEIAEVFIRETLYEDNEEQE